MTIINSLEALFKQNCNVREITDISREEAIKKMKNEIFKSIDNEKTEQVLIENVINIRMSLFEKYVNVLYDHLIRTESDSIN